VIEQGTFLTVRRYTLLKTPDFKIISRFVVLCRANEAIFPEEKIIEFGAREKNTNFWKGRQTSRREIVVAFHWLRIPLLFSQQNICFKSRTLQNIQS